MFRRHRRQFNGGKSPGVSSGAPGFCNTKMADTITLPEGTFEWYDALKPPPHTLITGAGRGKTIINWHWSFDHQHGSGCAIIPSDGCTIERLTINCVLATNHAGAVGCRVQDGDASFHGVLCRDCEFNGLSDCIYIRHDDACSLRIEDCTLTTKWDLVMLAGALHDVTITNCDMTANGTGFIINGSYQEANTTTVVGGKLAINNCYLRAVHPVMNTRGLWTVGAGEIGFVPGSSITASGGYVSAKQLIVEAEETVVETVETSFPMEVKLTIEKGSEGTVVISWWGESGYIYTLEATNDFTNWVIDLGPLDGWDGRMTFVRRMEHELRWYRLRIAPV